MAQTFHVEPNQEVIIIAGSFCMTSDSEGTSSNVPVLPFNSNIVIKNGKIVWRHGPSKFKFLWYLEIYQTTHNIEDHV